MTTNSNTLPVKYAVDSCQVDIAPFSVGSNWVCSTILPVLGTDELKQYDTDKLSLFLKVRYSALSRPVKCHESADQQAKGCAWMANTHIRFTTV
jgi:hypothetical protein